MRKGSWRWRKKQGNGKIKMISSIVEKKESNSPSKQLFIFFQFIFKVLFTVNVDLKLNLKAELMWLSVLDIINNSKIERERVMCGLETNLNFCWLKSEWNI